MTAPRFHATSVRCVHVVAEPGNGSRYELECYEQERDRWHVVLPMRWEAGKRGKGRGHWLAFHFDRSCTSRDVQSYSGLSNPIDAAAIALVLREVLFDQVPKRGAR